MSILELHRHEDTALIVNREDIESFSTPRERNEDGTLGKASVVLTLREGAIPAWVRDDPEGASDAVRW